MNNWYRISQSNQYYYLQYWGKATQQLSFINSMSDIKDIQLDRFSFKPSFKTPEENLVAYRISGEGIKNLKKISTPFREVEVMCSTAWGNNFKTIWKGVKPAWIDESHGVWETLSYPSLTLDQFEREIG